MCGIICRHIFYVSNMCQEKDLGNIEINPRWLVKDETKIESIKDIFDDFLNNQLSREQELSNKMQGEKTAKEENTIIPYDDKVDSKSKISELVL